MSFGFENVNTSNNKIYLKEAGVHENAKFLGLSYDATEQYEYFDIEIETADGRYFRERTFGPNKEKVFPKDQWKDGKKTGTETKEQAFERVQQEINAKLFYLGLCFCSREVLLDKVAKVKSLKELVDGVNKAIGTPNCTINFLTIWKNSEAKKKSNLIIAERIKWCEPYTAGRKATIQHTKYQIANALVEKFPYNGDTSNEGTNELVIDNGQPAGEASDLPF
jgi:hypothetical protein